MRTLFRALTSATLLTSLTTCSWGTWSGWLCWTGELDLIKRKSSSGHIFSVCDFLILLGKLLIVMICSATSYLVFSGHQLSASMVVNTAQYFLPLCCWYLRMFSNFDPILSGNPVVKLEMSNAWAQFIPEYPFSTKTSFYSEFWMLQVVNMNLYSIYTPILVITVGTFLIARWKLLIFIFKIEKLNLTILYIAVFSPFILLLWTLCSSVSWRIWRGMTGLLPGAILWSIHMYLSNLDQYS